jgi:predicted RNA-binding Zn-ribbon protein involved in translation (DUF1610 family)
MICRTCGHKIKEVIEYCPKCGIKLENNSEVMNIYSGDQSINLQGNNNKINIGKIENKLNRVEDIEINYESKIKMRLVKAKKLRNIGNFAFFITFIGVVADIISIWGGLKSGINVGYIGSSSGFKSDILLILVILMAMILLIIIEINILLKKGFIRLFPKSIFSFNLILLTDGTIAVISIKGKCPRCGGKIKLYYAQDIDKFSGICERNPSEHVYVFDYTKLSIE